MNSNLSRFFSIIFLKLIIFTPISTNAAPCVFDSTKSCALARDILNDTGTNGLKYYASTNYDHRESGEINVYDATLVKPYTDAINKPGQISLLAKLVNGNWRSGEIMTRADLNLPPYNSPVKSNPWTTKELTHGYLEIIVKMPKCDQSTDGLCQAGTQPNRYQTGLWPAIWMMPTMDDNWPLNGEIDISEAYMQGTDFQTSTTSFHFNGSDPRCDDGDCVEAGYSMNDSHASAPLWQAYHIWGFEWQSDPASTKGGQILTGYFDNKRVWGPIRTDTFPADGPNAMSRGFNDPKGGFYLIVNLALGGGYAGNPIPQMQTSSMYIQSIKAYNVEGSTPPPTNTCLAPADVKATWNTTKTSITLSWQKPTGSDTINNYQVNDWLNKVMWIGTALSFTDNTLPGTNGTFDYYLYSNCPSGQSPAVHKAVVINGPSPTNQCLPPRNVTGTVAQDRKSAQISWQAPVDSLPVLNYQVRTCQNRILWTGTNLSFIDTTLPGSTGSYSYTVYSKCSTGLSTGVPLTINMLHKSYS